MDKEQRELLFKLVTEERDRLNLLKYEYAYDSKEQDKIWKEISICNRTLIPLERKAYEDK